MAEKAQMRRRHWGLVLSFFLIVAAPLAIVGWYLAGRATDQYASSTGFSVRSEEGNSSAELIGGLTKFMGGSASGDTDILYEFIQSPDLVTRVDSRLDLRGHYTAPWSQDPVFSLQPDSTIEDLVDYWQRMVRISYDQNTGLVNLRVLAFSPDMAQRIAQEIIAESQTIVNELNATAREDMLKYAQEDLEEALVRLKAAREAMVRFRTRTQIVDPESDLQGRMGVLNSLQQQLAQALIDYDLLSQNTAGDDPRVIQAQRRIEVIRDRIAEERRTFASEDAGTGLENYPSLLAEYESLMVDREFAEESYRVALTALDLARANAARQSRYLATYLRPTLPEKSEFPRRLVLFSLSALFLFLIWSILSLVFYSLRDRK